jgi:hypothetical protein
MKLTKKHKTRLLNKPVESWTNEELRKMKRSVTTSSWWLNKIDNEIQNRKKNKDEFRIDGYLEYPEDKWNGGFEFKQEESRVLYPFMKIRSGGSDLLPQYCYILRKKNN